MECQDRERIRNTCKGMGVGKLFLNQAQKANPTYPIMEDEKCIIFIPFGEIQSLI